MDNSKSVKILTSYKTVVFLEIRSLLENRIPLIWDFIKKYWQFLEEKKNFQSQIDFFLLQFFERNHLVKFRHYWFRTYWNPPLLQEGHPKAFISIAFHTSNTENIQNSFSNLKCNNENSSNCAACIIQATLLPLQFPFIFIFNNK